LLKELRFQREAGLKKVLLFAIADGGEVEIHLAELGVADVAGAALFKESFRGLKKQRKGREGAFGGLGGIISPPSPEA